MYNDRQAGILGIGIYTPERKLTNQDLEKIVDTGDEWIVTRTGIRERRIAEPDQLTSDMATEAAKKAIADAGVKVDEIDLIIVATNTPDMLFPATACIVQDKLGARKVGAFDLQAGCTSFLYGMVIASQFIVSGFCSRILLIGAECMSRVVNWEDRNTCILFGDAAGAVIMGPVPDGYGILSSSIRSDGSGAHLLTFPGGLTQFPASKETLDKKLHFLHMHGREVFKFAVRNIEECCLDVLNEAGLTRSDIDYLIPHQANLRIIETAAKRLNVPLDKVAVNVDRYGNTSSATLPLALYESLQENKINDGQHIVMASFGAGLTWGALAMKWYDYRNHTSF
ncbi:MAG TPA: 3-oxoacyl-ACP synthase [Desulfotomaculum sp.]|nr:MAG: 3-oxoacyl-[acyl-carrier-protein] synthase 3 [Desulfotomaculum sp. 46_80]KUK85122.1 MAG: 3-oxoacyl-[acyl-carrier-protein] synthase 3 [Desulfofundulus kuznetsovii]HBY04606.1 3-oxoacyl-ACP synthase [Desulfotomaculum sp.]